MRILVSLSLILVCTIFHYVQSGIIFDKVGDTFNRIKCEAISIRNKVFHGIHSNQPCYEKENGNANRESSNSLKPINAAESSGGHGELTSTSTGILPQNCTVNDINNQTGVANNCTQGGRRFLTAVKGNCAAGQVADINGVCRDEY
ncbi:uncharacterized protein [Leptinotarsa decemlineata]|uniref:uncharacterized protein n=1 Tax=Leptinotarsa decemlineata TaxID=7539 RepID=UPI003D30CAE5